MADQYIVTTLIIAIVIMAAALIAIVMLIKELQAYGGKRYSDGFLDGMRATEDIDD